MKTLVMPMAVLAALTCSTPAVGQMSFEEAPINYKKAPVNDPVSRLQKQLDAGEVELRYDPRFGYLKSLLGHFDVPASSQALVFSKTSFQLKRISPRSPRALYFGDDVYIGWVQGGDVMEFSAVDPGLGVNFYTLSQRESAEPKFVRHTDTCLQCHGSSLTRGVPGHLVRSVYPDPDGELILSAGTFLTDQTSPLEQRWGGWYVTGRHGAQRHLGNLLVRESDDPRRLDTDKGANVTDLAARFKTSSYLTPHSDIVALLVLEHQTSMHNRITQANFLARLALRDQGVMNKMLERPDDYRSDSTKRRIANAGEKVVQYMLFAGEIKLTDPIQGTSAFAREFAARGPRDSQGRSLREFDLKTRLFKYPCSYLIYSEAFDGLPPAVKDHIYRRLWDVLTGEDKSDGFAHLSSEDRTAILAILRDTKRRLPDYWKISERATPPCDRPNIGGHTPRKIGFRGMSTYECDTTGELGEVFTSVQRSGNEDDLILHGDLNVDEYHLGELGRLPGITWAITSQMTNTRRTKAYDNLVFNRQKTAEYTGTCGVFDLMAEFGRQEKDRHHPVLARSHPIFRPLSRACKHTPYQSLLTQERTPSRAGAQFFGLNGPYEYDTLVPYHCRYIVP